MYGWTWLYALCGDAKSTGYMGFIQPTLAVTRKVACSRRARYKRAERLRFALRGQ